MHWGNFCNLPKILHYLHCQDFRPVNYPILCPRWNYIRSPSLTRTSRSPEQISAQRSDLETLKRALSGEHGLRMPKAVALRQGGLSAGNGS